MAKSQLLSSIAKLFPGQEGISNNRTRNVFPTAYKEIQTMAQAYQEIEVYNRCMNIITDTCSLVKYDVKDAYGFVATRPNIKNTTIDKLLNSRPNPYQDRISFWSACWMDFQLLGGFLIYFDGHSLYHMPMAYTEIVRGKEQRISHYLYKEGGVETRFKFNEVIYVADNGNNLGDYDVLGYARGSSSVSTATSLASLGIYHNNFFKNGSILGVVIETSEILSKRHKERTEDYISQKYNPKRGAFKPMILDNNMKAKTLNSFTFSDLDFKGSNDALDGKVCMALGVPPILLSGGNNANIRPNVELLLNFTIIPMVKKLESALESFFGFNIQISVHEVPALLPDQVTYWKMVESAVNNGVITGDEGREMLRLEPLKTEEMTNIRIPANIAGSATGVTGQEGGSPSSGDKNE